MDITLAIFAKRQKNGSHNEINRKEIRKIYNRVKIAGNDGVCKLRKRVRFSSGWEQAERICGSTISEPVFLKALFLMIHAGNFKWGKNLIV